MSVRDLADVYAAIGDTAKADSVYGKEFIEGRASSLAYALLQYASFWASKKMNEESAMEMAEMALRMKPEEDYYKRLAASVSCQLNKMDKALEFFGPTYAGKNKDDASKLITYAGFWANQGSNLQSALDAAKRSVELSPSLAGAWGALAQVHMKMKKSDEAIKAGEKAVEVAGENQKTYYKNRLEAMKKEAGSM
jgi:tetratricopeptide (TPR) repeat protein